MQFPTAFMLLDGS